jgi:hypothetical protein
MPILVVFFTAAIVAFSRLYADIADRWDFIKCRGCGFYLPQLCCGFKMKSPADVGSRSVWPNKEF